MFSGNDIFKFQIAQSSHSSAGKGLEFVLRDDANTLQFFSNPAKVLTDGKWHHCVVTNSAGTVQFYTDGLTDGASASQTATNTLTDANFRTLIGGDIQDVTAYITAKIDEVGIWNRALSATEVTQLFNRGNGLEYPLNGYTTLAYRYQSKIETLSRKSANSSYRMRDQMVKVYGGRGEKYDELVYLNGKNSDASGVNRKKTDAWTKFSKANGVTGTSRADQAEREFYIQGNYP